MAEEVWQIYYIANNDHQKVAHWQLKFEKFLQ